MGNMINLDDVIQEFICCVSLPPDCKNCPQHVPGDDRGHRCRSNVKVDVLHALEAYREHIRGESRAIAKGDDCEDGQETQEVEKEHQTQPQDHSEEVPEGFQNRKGKAGMDQRKHVESSGTEPAFLLVEEKRVADIEKVKHGLRECTTHRRCTNPYCPYANIHGCRWRLEKDALELLDAQDEVIRALLKVGYPHNFQREERWIVNYMYAITDVVKKAVHLSDQAGVLRP